MIQKFVDRFVAREEELREQFSLAHPDSYTDIVQHVVTLVSNEDDYSDSPDPSRMHVIDDGDYQGTRLYIFASYGYQPWTYWIIKVSYGSCSGCDTFESIRGYDNDEPSSQQVDDYMTLALHMIQSMKEV